MRTAFLLISQFAVLATLLVAHAAPTPKDPRTPAKIDLDRLDGTWRVTSIQVAGAETHANGQELLITFKNGEFAWGNGGGNAGKITAIDPSRNPKEITYTFHDGPDKGMVLKGIYKFDGDTFTDCFGRAGGERPAKFSSTQENGYYLMTYERVKKTH
ncbi:MAG TPA: TIGR03067 domain-containing protein [Gemmata sp.]|nr:TIGR03067 domain-containing protein [Gemmata sp.]